MSSPDYDRIITQERNVLASVKEQAEELIPEFKRVTTSYIRELSIKLMKRYFESRPEVVRSLGAEKLEEIKIEFTDLVGSFPDQTSKRFDDNQIWLHRIGIPKPALSDMTYSYQLEKRSNKAMDDAIRELIGLVGSLLMEYGFIDVGKDFTWKMTEGGIPLYANELPSRGMDHHRALSKLMEQYKNILIEYVYATQNLRKAEQDKEAAQLD
jgi:hypothetical protein